MDKLPSDAHTSEVKTEPDFLSRFGRHFAHELNNPISAISSAVYLLEEFASSSTNGQLSIEEALPFITGIHEECDALKRIVQEFSRYVTTTSVLTGPLDLVEFIRKRVEDMRRDGVPVEFLGPEISVTILGDAGSLQTALRTLVKEAVDSGATLVQIRVTSDPCEIQVRDDRKPETLPADPRTIFEPLGSGRPKQGLGLELPLVKKIVDLHEGTIERTVEPTGGTVTTIRISRAVSV